MLTTRALRASTPSYQAYRILHVSYTIAPLVGGVDKFVHLMGRLGHVSVPERFGLTAPVYMVGAGLIELSAAAIVALNPRVGGWLVGFWLLAIALMQLGNPAEFDLAARDVGLAVGAFALARLSEDY